jgi:hypothetical protein
MLKGVLPLKEMLMSKKKISGGIKFTGKSNYASKFGML